jgi:hypothetical protein
MITRPVLGWREWISLPELGLAVKAKVDTGARSSALHAFDIETFRRRGKHHVRFKVHPVQRETRTTVITEAEMVDEKRVRDSGGTETLRPVIHTPITINDMRWEIEITLTNRDVMGFRMLLGRQAIRGRYVVDPGRSFLLGRPVARRPVQKKRKKKD